jgi:hypothetical protein
LSPWLRLPLLFATVVATVATSPPFWQVADHTEKRTEHVEPNATVETRLEAEASHHLGFSIALENLVSRDGKLRIEVLDSRADCKTEVTYQSDDGIWRPLPESKGASSTESKLHRIDFHDSCSSTDKRATLTVRFVNEGPGALDFDWQASVTSSGEESDDAPDGAFAKVTVLP